MKFLCVTCDEPMTLTRADPPDGGGSITAVFVCPTCDHRIAMLTNAHETQMVQSLGVRIGPAEEPKTGGCPFSGMIAEPDHGGDVPTWTAGAEQRLANIPEFVRPMARQGIEHYARSHGHRVIDDQVMEEARGQFGM